MLVEQQSALGAANLRGVEAEWGGGMRGEGGVVLRLVCVSPYVTSHVHACAAGHAINVRPKDKLCNLS